MLLDFKYHLFTISAIFAALGLGILIGTSIIGQEGLIKEQKKLVEHINKDIKNIKEENLNLTADINQLREELSYRKKMEKKIVSLFLQDVMQDQKFLIYTENNDKLQQIAEIKDIFKTAGASLQIVNNYQQLNHNNEGDDFSHIEQFNQVIFWDISSLTDDIKEELRNDFGNKILFCQRSDIIGLLLEIIENNNLNLKDNNSIKEEKTGEINHE